jgi:hypothetical protein
MIIIGSGNTGSKLATKLDNKALIFSTAREDSNNFPNANIIYVSEDGASKRFRKGTEIWKENFEKLKQSVSNIRNEKVVIFSSLGGGSGASSLEPISKLLLENNNKVLVVGIIPFIKENNPPLSNAVQSINSLMPLMSKVSVLLFDNQKLIKKFNNDWTSINHYIVKRVDYIINILKKYNTNNYSPMTLDQSELESVVFGGGFLDISDTFLEEKAPKFEYGRLDKDTKNCLIAMLVDNKIDDNEILDEYQGNLTQIISKLSGRARNARIIPGILRASLNFSNAEEYTADDRAYLTIASGLSIDRYIKKIQKLRDSAIDKASHFAEKIEGEKILDTRESKLLDI